MLNGELPPRLLPRGSRVSFKRTYEGAELAAHPSTATGSALAAGQEQAIAAALEPGNVFITGGAGVGKSFVAGLIASRFRDTHAEGEVGLCALTGIAALTLGNGANLHAREGHPRSHR